MKIRVILLSMLIFLMKVHAFDRGDRVLLDGGRVDRNSKCSTVGSEFDGALDSRAEKGIVKLDTLKGVIVNEANLTMVGVSIQLKEGARTIGISDVKGKFTVQAQLGEVLLISFVGYNPIEIPAARNMGVIKMVPSAGLLDEVVVSMGVLERRKESFTGAVSLFTGAELKQVGNTNAIQSLRTLDPSFIVVTNNLAGSNPNQMPAVQVRGGTSVTNVRDEFAADPNLPLFILNGFEVDMQQIVDLDMNRIASITLLKDAASTALYGGRASNGVVVVETVKPKPGQLTLSYISDWRFEVPDLSSYNMMNVAENLEFQRLAGYYELGDPLYNAVSQRFNDNMYNARLTEVMSGVNSYWLDVPLEKVGVTQNHNVNLNGGSSDFQFNMGVNYRGMKGVMKGSDRQTWGGSLQASYRTKKFNFSNYIFVNGYDANDSPYGSFANYVNINPYYRKFNEDGSLNLDRYLVSYEVYTPAVDNGLSTRRVVNVNNPLFNASLNSRNNTSNYTVMNSTQLIYTLSPVLRLQASGQISKATTKTIAFIPSANTLFDNVDVYNRGNYAESVSDLLGYQANMMLTYNQVINEMHSLNGNLRAEAMDDRTTFTGFSAVGFPEGANPNPFYAFSYTPNASPDYSRVRQRGVGFLGSINYAFDQRIYVDATLRIDGTSAFGVSNKFSPFYSVGLGWTVNKEKFMQSLEWLSLLRLRGNIGLTGNQSLGNYSAPSIYQYSNDINYYGMGLYLSRLGTPGIDWQNTRQISVGTDISVLHDRLNATINAFSNFTNPLIVNSDVPASTGVTNTYMNMGSLTTEGIEWILRYSPIFQPSNRKVWTVGLTGSTTRSVYSNIGNSLTDLDDYARDAGFLQRYRDGGSPNDLWAVRSLGIDPATGAEVYQTLDGLPTFVYDADNEVSFGSSLPIVQGVFSNNININGFLFGINLRYSIGATRFNSALFEKVENISWTDLQNNQDARALDLRWQQPGDITQFRSISTTDNTPISSRFIQKESYISGESINFGYEFQSSKHAWMKGVGLSTIRFNLYTNEAFYWSNVLAERGTNYPYTRSVSASVNVFF